MQSSKNNKKLIFKPANFWSVPWRWRMRFPMPISSGSPNIPPALTIWCQHLVLQNILVYLKHLKVILACMSECVPLCWLIKDDDRKIYNIYHISKCWCKWRWWGLHLSPKSSASSVSFANIPNNWYCGLSADLQLNDDDADQFSSVFRFHIVLQCTFT